MILSVSELRAMTMRAVASYGYSPEESATISDVLMYAQLRGNNQGVVKLLPPGIPRDATAGEIRVVRDLPGAAVVDGARNHAMIVVSRATEIAIGKARSAGVATVGVNNLNTSSGAIGYYARRIAEQGIVGLVFAGAPPTVAPEGSYRPLLGTNPLAVAVPSSDGPVVLDLATAAMALFGVIEAKTSGRLLPEGVALDREGAPTLDPAAALEGAIRTFDRGPKSSGLSFMVQALAGPLVGASFLGAGHVQGNWGGHLIIAVDPAVLGGAEAMTRGVSEMVSRFHAAPPSEPGARVLVPGERGDQVTAAAEASDSVEVDDALVDGLSALLGD